MQLDEKLLATLDERAARSGRSRSHVIREAIEAYLKSERDAEIDAAIIEGYTRFPPGELDDWAEESARRSVEAEPW